MNRNAGFGYAVGMITGMAVGVAVTPLVAPKSGAEPRATIRHEAGAEVRRANDEVHAKLDDMNAGVTDLSARFDKARHDLTA